MNWLDIMIIFLCCIIEVFLLYDYFANFFEKKIPDKYARMVSIVTVGTIFIVNLFANSILNLIFVPLILWMFVTVLFDAKIGIRFRYSFLAYSAMIGVEFLYAILSDATAQLLTNNRLILVLEYAWELLIIKLLNYIAFPVLKQSSSKAKQTNINFDAYVEPGCQLSHIRDVDLITMLGNLLDNALLAATNKGMGSSVVVRIFMQKDGKLCAIKVANDFAGQIKEIKGKIVSTKKEKGIHGIGLASVSKIAEQYDGYLEYYVEEEVFNAVIVLPV